MLRCHDATVSSFITKVWGEVFTNFDAVTLKITVVFVIDCLACQDKFYVNNPFNVTCLTSLFVSAILEFSVGGLLLCLRVITINPDIIISDNPGQEDCIVEGDLM
jgi:hypothetical protein